MRIVMAIVYGLIMNIIGWVLSWVFTVGIMAAIMPLGFIPSWIILSVIVYNNFLDEKGHWR